MEKHIGKTKAEGEICEPGEASRKVDCLDEEGYRRSSEELEGKNAGADDREGDEADRGFTTAKSPVARDRPWPPALMKKPAFRRAFICRINFLSFNVTSVF